MTLRELAKEIGAISAVSNKDALAVLDALLNIIPQELSKGNIAELGEFGSFWLKANAEGADTAATARSASSFC